MSTPRIDAEWLKAGSLQKLLAALEAEGEEARVIGGAVRNTLLGLSVADIDIATTTLPDETMRRAGAAGFKAVPTGIEHGTVTIVAGSRVYETTTLREDVETDGRHARVRFGRDFKADAERRDFTINALACDREGRVFDHVGGLPDLERRVLRFIGEPEQRIREDYLRILRFFRFFAWYGTGRPDAGGLRAAARLKEGVLGLSAERVWAELHKLLSAPDPSRALLWMRQTGVLSLVLPESEKWGIDAIHGLIEAEAALGWTPDALRRLQAIVPPDGSRLQALADRLRLSKAQRGRLLAWASAEPADPEEPAARLRKRLYFGDRDAIADRLRLALSAERAKAAAEDAALMRAAKLAAMLREAEGFDPPAFPLTGNDLKAAGIEVGPRLGETLRDLQAAWVDSGFVLSGESLLARLRSGT